MAMKEYRPTSAGRRFQTSLTGDELTRAAEPVRGLLDTWQRSGGRNNTGRITLRYRGGGAKRRYRTIEFRRSKVGIPGTVVSINYDPNRSANLAQLNYADGAKSYILHAVGVKVGDVLVASPTAEIRPGNALPLKNIPVGTAIHNVELKIGAGAQMCRSAGTQTQIMAKEDGYVLLKLPSGETRKVLDACWATIGQVGNEDHHNLTYGKAGRIRWMGRKPHVRGMAMNPVDHPHGGGEGRSKGGNHPCSPTGVLAKGFKTRRPKPSDKMIVKRRKK